MDNFKCPTCKKSHHYTESRYNGVIHKDKWGKEIICDCKDKTPLTPIPKEGMPNIGTFSAMNKEAKVAHLQKRATAHSDKFHNYRDID